ncbi:hypothetical protein [Streptosporangium sandarakinum]|uniref:hypothetical protein n=1 Tax=Streptosporangium sandarakinum TaxID=1260955 RepID=UPI003682D87B
MSECLAPHVGPLQAGHVLLTWITARRDERCRVIAWTCHCRSVVYELCSAGGQSYLRRTVQGPRPDVTETARTNASTARELWAALLTGRVR